MKLKKIFEKPVLQLEMLRVQESSFSPDHRLQLPHSRPTVESSYHKPGWGCLLWGQAFWPAAGLPPGVFRSAPRHGEARDVPRSPRPKSIRPFAAYTLNHG